jgi:ankyrin repeat protein
VGDSDSFLVAAQAMAGFSGGGPNAALCLAARRGNLAEMERLIAAGADPNAFRGTVQVTPLQYAALYAHAAAISLLLTCGADVNGASCGSTPLMDAACSGHVAAIDVMCAGGANVNCRDDDADTALHRASCNGRVAAAHALLRAGAFVNARNRDGDRPVDVVSALQCVLERNPCTPAIVGPDGAGMHAIVRGGHGGCPVGCL